ALGVLADSGIGVFYGGEPLGAVEAGADLVAALRITALAFITRHFRRVEDGNEAVRALEALTGHNI
ncbi:MAG: hypothetical protein ABJO54_03355, partial [Hyphomicrobiales bacterium]